MDNRQKIDDWGEAVRAVAKHVDDHNLPIPLAIHSTSGTTEVQVHHRDWPAYMATIHRPRIEGHVSDDCQHSQVRTRLGYVPVTFTTVRLATTQPPAVAS